MQKALVESEQKNNVYYNYLRMLVKNTIFMQKCLDASIQFKQKIYKKDKNEINKKKDKLTIQNRIPLAFPVEINKNDDILFEKNERENIVHIITNKSEVAKSMIAKSKDPSRLTAKLFPTSLKNKESLNFSSMEVRKEKIGRFLPKPSYYITNSGRERTEE